MILAAVDPGSGYFGCAVFRGSALLVGMLHTFHHIPTEAYHLQAEEMVRFLHEEVRLRVQQPVHVVIEQPHQWPNMSHAIVRSVEKLSNIVAASRVALIHAQFSVETVKPVEWKGNVAKKPMIRRVKKRLTAAEMVTVQDVEHVWDAVGIGLWRVGRLRKEFAVQAKMKGRKT